MLSFAAPRDLEVTHLAAAQKKAAAFKRNQRETGGRTQTGRTKVLRYEYRLRERV